MTGTVRVLVDATAIPADRGGVGRYVDELLPALAARGLDLVVVCQRTDVAHVRSLVPSARVLPAPAATSRRPVRLLWEQVALPWIARRERVDVLHSPHYTMPLVSRVPSVVTLHDATFFSHPAMHSSLKRRFFGAWTRYAVRHADALVVPSASTRDAVLEHVGGRPEAFHVAYHGVRSTTFHPVDDAERARVARSLGLEGRSYVAFLGTLEPRKNVPALVRAWVAVCTGRDAPPALVLAGGRGWDDGVDPALAAVPTGLTVVRPGYLPLADLPGYLSGAAVVAYPSVGEGFGLPVLEAMACGAAVLTTRETSLPEVGGDAVAYTGVTEGEIAAALGALLDDPGRRAELAAAAERRAATFTWEAAADGHVAAYRQALARTRRRAR
ncbi:MULTISPECIES: glycosyltransferase family 4 protein [Cellulomonas]|uniref:glycosyltransferase family 4 protein n=1 Tax=Cellulomonas TaxID=1707 RepID=UPI000ADD997F|nr:MULTISPECIES: glycosyltransferase family 1 protein [Cellulomonas]